MNVVSHIVRWRGAEVPGPVRTHKREALIQGNGHKAWVSCTGTNGEETSARLMGLIVAQLREWGVTVD